MAKTPKRFQSESKTYRRLKRGVLGQGGNGLVCQVKTAESEYALKALLKSNSSKQRERFFYEVKLLETLSESPGVISIVDSNIESAPYFYVMELGVDSLTFLADKDESEIVASIGKLADSLEQLHQQKIYHRDIKPENILFVNSEPVLADFGLAIRHGDPRITKDGDKQIGAKSTMAPEMLRDPYNADYAKADVYSLAKTLWILLTKKITGFDGCYSTHGPENLWDHDVRVLGSIEQMLTESTSNDPKSRWSLSDIKLCCDRYVEIANEKLATEKEAWRLLKNRLFPHFVPEKAEWTSVGEILKILELILNKRCWNHTVLPCGGGFELDSVKRSNEPGCIELIWGEAMNIVRPHKLTFYSPGGDSHGAQDYFLLEAKQLNFVSPYHTDYYEELTELSPLHYTASQCTEWNDFNACDLPKGSRFVVRWHKGKFGIFMCGSLFIQKGLPFVDKLADAYSAIHEKISEDRLFTIFQKYLKKQERHTLTNSENRKPQYEEPTSTKLKRTLLTQRQEQVILSAIQLFQEELAEDSSQPDDPLDLRGLTPESLAESIEEVRQRYTKLCDLSKRDIRLINAVYHAARGYSPPYGTPLDVAVKNQNHFILHEWDALCEHRAESIIEALQKGIEMYSEPDTSA